GAGIMLPQAEGCCDPGMEDGPIVDDWQSVQIGGSINQDFALSGRRQPAPAVALCIHYTEAAARELRG
ncbi:MAG: hypothetical protein V4710_14385, partial [Verrucomicrobiota bacterium]